MLTIDSSKTLLSKLNDNIDEISRGEIKEYLSSLFKVNELKRFLSLNMMDGSLFDDFLYELKTECLSTNIKIDYIEDDTRTLLYSSEDDIEYTYLIKIDFNKIIIEICIDPDTLAEYELLKFSTYCNEIAQLFSIYHIIRQLKKTISIDPLTQLQSRASLNNELKRIVPLAIREKMRIGVLLINIDRFRAVNDEHGDAFGDAFLRLYADTLQKNIRSSDIAVRFGGGEFLVILVHVPSIDSTMQIAKKIQDTLTNTYLLSPHNDKFKKTVSIGVSLFPDDSNDINEVIKFSEMALLDVKYTGRNKLLRYEKSHKGSIELF